MGKKYIIELEDENYHQYSDSEPSDYLWRVKGFNALVFDEVGISKLTPYTEPDLELIKEKAHTNGYGEGYQDGYNEGMNDYLQSPEVKEESDRAYAHGYSDAESKFSEIRKEAYDKGFEDGKELCPIPEVCHNNAYQKGLSDAWEAARKICLEDDDGGIPASAINDIFSVRNYRNALRDFSVSEAIEKIRQYEQKQEESEEPKKEQSVTVEEVMRQYLNTFCHGRSCMSCPLNAPNFTCGRGYHFITNPVSDEEVRRAYTTVLQKMKEN